MGLKLTIAHDHDSVNPVEDWDGMWKPYSFNTRHVNFKEPQELGIERDGSCTDPELAQKLKEGLAFLLGYYEHGPGTATWSVQGYAPPGADCPWDSVSLAGVLVWEEPPDNMGAKTYEDRQKDAAGCLETYNNWCNGNVYGYSIDRLLPCGECGHKEEEHVDSCWGFFDAKGLFEAIRESLPDGEEIEEITGDAAWLADFHKLPSAATV